MQEHDVALRKHMVAVDRSCSLTLEAGIEGQNLREAETIQQMKQLIRYMTQPNDAQDFSLKLNQADPMLGKSENPGFKVISLCNE